MQLTLCLVDGHYHTQHANTAAANKSPKHHHAVAIAECLEHAANGEEEGADAHRPAAAVPVRQMRSEKRGYFRQNQEATGKKGGC